MSRRFVMTFAAFALGASCGVPPGGSDGGGDSGLDASSAADASVFVPTERRPLGLNDVTYFLPLEQLDASTPFPPASTILPLGAFTRLTEAQPVVRTDLSRLRVLAVRVDACDRPDTNPCASDADGSMRLVLQPVFGTPANVEDVTFHAFFPIPRAEMPEVVDTLRALGAMQNIARGAPLQISTAFRSDATFRSRLGALVARYAQSQRLNRLTLFGQESERAAIVWIFRGEEVPTGGGTVLGPISIPSIAMPQQEVLLFGGDSYQVTPVADEPVGFARVVMEPMFRAGTSSQQLDGVRALLAVDNPSLHSANSAQCVSCHVATTLVPLRAGDAGIDVTMLTERYSSTMFDLTPLGSVGRARTLRALGYFGSNPLVSQRVVNETANVVGALEAMYPPPP